MQVFCLRPNFSPQKTFCNFRDGQEDEGSRGETGQADCRQGQAGERHGGHDEVVRRQLCPANQDEQ